MIKSSLKINRNNAVRKSDFILTALVGLLVFISTAYVDLKSLTVWSTNVWDVTVDSNIFHLYEYTAQNIYGVRHQYMGSELMSVLPWSVWNLPIWLIQRFGGCAIVYNPLLLGWSKLFLVFLSIVTLYYTYKIALILTNDSTKSRFCVFLTSSSVYLYIGVCYAGQNDIIMITASVIAVYYLLKNKNTAFFIWSAIAISIKPFFLFAYIALILLIDKNIIRIMLKAILGVSGIALQKLMFYNAPMYKESLGSGPTSNMLKNLFPVNIKISSGGISFFAVALVLIYFYAYILKIKSTDRSFDNIYAKYIIYFIVLIYASYLFLSPFAYYRIILLLPFLYLMICQNEKYRYYNILLDVAMMGGLTMQILLRKPNFCRVSDTHEAIIQQITGMRAVASSAKYGYLYDFVIDNLTILKYIQPLFSSIAFICAILLIIFNHPEYRIKLPKEAGSCPRWLTVVRTLIIVPFILALLWLYAKAPHTTY